MGGQAPTSRLRLLLMGRARQPAGVVADRRASQLRESESYALLFAEARRSLAAQESSVDELRSRCGVMLSATGVMSAFLGAVVMSGLLDPSARVGPSEFVTNGIKLAVGLAILASVCFVVPLAPRSWTFRLSAKRLLADYIETDPPASVAEIHRSLAWYFSQAETDNAGKLSVLYWMMTVGGALFIAELVVWFLVLYQRLTP
jgi:hypothetical protein